MTHIKLTIDGEVLMNGDMGEWQQKPPSALVPLLTPGKPLQPYLQAALGALVESVLKEIDAEIECTNKESGDGWTVDVTYKGRQAAKT